MRTKKDQKQKALKTFRYQFENKYTNTLKTYSGFIYKQITK